jgi:hypothetical protein
MLFMQHLSLLVHENVRIQVLKLTHGPQVNLKIQLDIPVYQISIPEYMHVNVQEDCIGTWK